MKQKYLEAFMKCAEAFAETSTANRLKVGCVIEKDGALISVGLNGTPVGWHTNMCEDIDGYTLPEVRHAEMNAILKLAKSNVSAVGATMFISHAPCLRCSLDILEVGITKVYYRNEYRSRDGIEWLLKNGVEVIKL